MTQSDQNTTDPEVDYYTSGTLHQWNSEQFARNDWNGERFAQNDWNSERNAERFALNDSN
jgi:hypothetical protein